MARPSTAVVHNAKQTANGILGLMIIGGSLGTSDTLGTQELIRASGNPATGAAYVEVIGGVSVTGGSNVNIFSGNVGTVGNIGVLHNGTVVVSSVPQISVGTLPQVSVGTLPPLSITSGSQQTLGTLGTVLGVGTITAIGQIHNAGTIQNVNNGTLALVTTVSNLTNGSINVLSGTQQLLGTLQLGTVKIDPTTIPQMIQFGTLGTAGGSFFGTISAVSGAGTKHYIQGVDIVMQSGTADVRVLAGTVIQGTGVLAAGQFVPSAGIAKNWNPHFNTGTNSEITYHFVGAGTAFITVSYWKGV